MKNKIVSLSAFHFIFFILMGCIFQSCVSPRDLSIKKWERHEWKLVKADKNDAPTWKIYTRKIAGTTSVAYKIEGNINSSPQACLAAFKHGLHQQTDESMQKKYPTYDISEESEKGLLTYVVHNEPFPLKDTEMSVRYLFTHNEDGGIRVTWQEAWEDCPIQATKKLSRVETFRGSWDFIPMDKNLCQGVKTVQFDPNKMPRWLFEPMVFKFLIDGLKEINEIANESNMEITSLRKN